MIDGRESQYMFFDTPEECADAAAPVFLTHRWRWQKCGIPERQEILERLNQMADRAVNNNLEGGRLMFLNGRFGYQRPTGMLSDSIWERKDNL